jgi:hypothetical protein
MIRKMRNSGTEEARPKRRLGAAAVLDTTGTHEKGPD